MVNDRYYQVIIIGAGFAGLSAANELKKNRNLKITIIDGNNYHIFQPFLYQVACADLAPSDITIPIRNQFKGYKNISVYMDKAVLIDKDEQKVYTKNNLRLHYDYLLIATGSESNYFNFTTWKEHTVSLKTLKDAVLIKEKLLYAFEKAELHNHKKRNQVYTTFVIVGGGSTGVEMAGAISELINCALKSDFNNIDPTTARIILIEGSNQVLPSFHPSLSQYASRTLERKGVTIKLNLKVNNISKNTVVLSNGEIIRAHLIIWAAGVKATSIKSLLGEGVAVNNLGKVKVQEDLSLGLKNNIFVAGDASEVIDERGIPLPGLAAVATQQGKFVAEAICERINVPSKRLKFRYKNLGQLAIVGRYSAVAEIFHFRLKGILAWLMWDLVHIYFLIGFRNRLIVFIKWMWGYITYGKSDRTITNKDS